MKIDKKISSAFVLSIVLATWGHCQKAEASTLTITNHTQSNIVIRVVAAPEGADYCKSCLATPPSLGGRETIIIDVPVHAFPEGRFSVLNDAGFMDQSTCKNLNVLKNYTISFVETTHSTRCHAKEIL